MGLRDIVISRTEVLTKGGSFHVRGMTFSDLTVLASTYGPEVSAAFAALQSQGKASEGDIKTVLADLMPEVPHLVAATIALASDDFSEETIAVAERLPFKTQAEALEAIFLNTFESESDLKKFLESVTRMLVGAATTIGQMRLQTSELGSGLSVVK